jgi:hypothetical protein
MSSKATGSKHSTKSSDRQELIPIRAAQVEFPLPLLSVLEDVEHASFGSPVGAKASSSEGTLHTV